MTKGNDFYSLELRNPFSIQNKTIVSSFRGTTLYNYGFNSFSAATCVSASAKAFVIKIANVYVYRYRHQSSVVVQRSVQFSDVKTVGGVLMDFRTDTFVFGVETR